MAKRRYTTPDETVTLSQAKALIRALAHSQSLLLLSPPGLGKSDTVLQAAADAGLPCRSLLGTQIAPEDVSGVPRIVGERSVFCPPRILLPENPEPFCLFLDELPACPPDVQKSFYSLLLERRLGEHRLPPGTWVVAAGNRLEDRALVRTLSSALINRVVILQVRVDYREWLAWAKAARVRPEILAFITFMPHALMRTVPTAPVPFSTPRAWASLSTAMDLAEQAGILTPQITRALAFGRLSAEDAAVFCAMTEHHIADLRPIAEYLAAPDTLPNESAALWFILNSIRLHVRDGRLPEMPADALNRFLLAIPADQRFALLIDMVDRWAALGVDPALLATLKEATGL